MDIYGVVTAVVGGLCLLLGTAFGYFLRATEREPESVEPEALAQWDRDTEKMFVDSENHGRML